MVHLKENMKHGFPSVAEQVALAIKDGLRQGRWKETIPGRNRLATELGVNHKTVKAALAILENEGLLESRGPGRERRIIETSRLESVPLRVMLLAYEPNDRKTDYLLDIVHRLHLAGHIASFASKTLTDLDRSVERVARFVEQTTADAWILIAAPTDILDWFTKQPLPAFGLFGPVMKFPIASTGPTKLDVLRELVLRLCDLGHRRIVMLTRESNRKPNIGLNERVFLETLGSRGIPTGLFNLPDWGDTPDDLRKNIDSLFRHTAPTALIVDDPVAFSAVVQHLGRLGMAAPEQISLACTDPSPAFDWCRPKVTHITWNHKTVVTRVVNWARQTSYGKDDRRKNLVKATLEPGGTIGPAP